MHVRISLSLHVMDVYNLFGKTISKNTNILTGYDENEKSQNLKWLIV